jgi:5'-deoxynucleotidase
MQSKFFAFMARLKYINRWSLMRNTYTENVAEHSLSVSLIAHALAVISNEYFGGNYDACKIGMIGAYHETSEVITGDLPTPIKYFSPEIRDSYKAIEKTADERILSTLPDDLRAKISSLVYPTEEEYRIVKYADKIAAYIKCVEEVSCGNGEFVKAEKSTKALIDEIDDKAVKYFMDVFVPAFKLSLDELSL